MKKSFRNFLIIICVACLLLTSIVLVACNGASIDDKDLLYTPNQNKNEHHTYNGITIDGVLNDEEWGNLSAYECEITLNSIPHTFKISATLCDEGVILAYSLRGSTVFRNPSNGYSDGSCVELYFASGDATQTKNNAWQIELMPDGSYNTMKLINDGYTNYNMYMEHAAVVDGVLNEENNGYDGEALIPWALLDGERYNTVCMDAAIIIQRDFDESRWGWYSVTSMTKHDEYSWDNPQGWLHFTEKGWFDKDTAVVYKVNDGAELQHATVDMVGSYNQGSVLTIQPEDGYVLKSLSINGTKYNSLAVTMPTGTMYADVQMEIVPATGTKMQIPVVAGYAYTEKATLNNSAVTLIDDQNNFYAGMTDSNGTLTVYLPDGEFSFDTIGYSGKKIEVENGTITNGLVDGKLALTKHTITIDYVQDSVKDDLTIKQLQNGDSLSYTGSSLSSSKNRFVIGQNEDFTNAVVQFTVGDTKGSWVDLRVDTVKAKNAVLTSIEHSNKAGEYCQISFRTADGTSTFQVGAGETITASKTTSASYMLSFSTKNGITTVGIYVKNGSSYDYFGYFKCEQVTSLFLSGNGSNWDNPVKLTKVKFLTGKDIQSSITVSDESSSQVDVNVVDTAYLGEVINVSITPKQATDGCEIAVKELYINGEQKSFELNYDGSVSFVISVNNLAENFDIKVVTEEVAKTDEITFTAQHKYDSEDNYVDFVGGDITFVSGNVTKHATCVNGNSYKVKLADGTYIVRVAQHDDTTVTVENGVLSVETLQLIRAKVWVSAVESEKDKVNLSQNADGSYSIKTSGSLSADNLIVIGSGVDFTNTATTMDINWKINVSAGVNGPWIDFRMNSDDKYDNERSSSAEILDTEHTKHAWDSGIGNYYMFDLWTTSYTVLYKVGGEGKVNYLDIVGDKGASMPYDTVSVSIALQFETSNGVTTASLYVKQMDGTYGKVGTMTGAAVKDVFLLGTGGGWDSAVEINNIKFFENVSNAD